MRDGRGCVTRSGENDCERAPVGQDDNQHQASPGGCRGVNGNGGGPQAVMKPVPIIDLDDLPGHSGGHDGQVRQPVEHQVFLVQGEHSHAQAGIYKRDQSPAYQHRGGGRGRGRGRHTGCVDRPVYPNARMSAEAGFLDATDAPAAFLSGLSRLVVVTTQ
eukprot:jgi/Chrzof1/2367/Cz11g12150.t1